jgi:hypothetical protein
MRDRGDNLKDVGPRLSGEDDWRIETYSIRKNQSPKYNQFKYRLAWYLSYTAYLTIRYLPHI